MTATGEPDDAPTRVTQHGAEGGLATELTNR